MASGVAALGLVGLLIFAVVRVADNSVDPPHVVYPDTSVAITTSFTTSSSTTSYTTPSVQTSEFTPPPAPSPPAPPPDDGGPTSTPDTSTTIYNPYAPTSGSAGHV